MWYCTVIVEAASVEDAVQEFNESLVGNPHPDESEFADNLGVAEDQPYYAQEVEEHKTYKGVGERVRIDI